MKEIKFRAWDKEKGKMFEPTFRAYAGELEELHISLDGRLGLRKFDGYHDQSMFPERFEVMQYTGLKDKNGVEIYEGDIVRCFRDGPSEVVFKKGCFGLETYTSIGNYYYTFDEVYGYCEIIGNIYENPELLESEGK